MLESPMSQSFPSTEEPRTTAGSDLALCIYAESALGVPGRRGLVIGAADAGLAERLLALGARSVHLFDPDAARAEAAAQGEARRGLTVRVLDDRALDFRDGAFDFALVAELAEVPAPALVLTQVRRILERSGSVLVRTRDVASGGIEYADLFDLVSLEFPYVAMIGEVPFGGVAFAELGADAPEVSVDSQLADTPSPRAYLAFGSYEPRTLDGYSIVQLPSTALQADAGNGRSVPVYDSGSQAGETATMLADAAEMVLDARARELEDAEAVARLTGEIYALREELDREGEKGMRLAMELETAQRKLETAQRQVETEKRHSEAAQRQAEAAQRQAEAEKRQAEAAQRQVEAAQRQAEAAQRQVDAEKRSAETRIGEAMQASQEASIALQVRLAADLEEKLQAMELDMVGRLAETEAQLLSQDAQVVRLSKDLIDAKKRLEVPTVDAKVAEDLAARLAQTERKFAAVEHDLGQLAGEHVAEVSSLEAQLLDRARMLKAQDHELARRATMVEDLLSALEEAAVGADVVLPERPAQEDARLLEMKRRLDEMAIEAARREAELEARSWRISELELQRQLAVESAAEAEAKRKVALAVAEEAEEKRKLAVSAAEKAEAKASENPPTVVDAAPPALPPAVEKLEEELFALRQALVQEHSARVAAESGEALHSAQEELRRQAVRIEELAHELDTRHHTRS